MVDFGKMFLQLTSLVVVAATTTSAAGAAAGLISLVVVVLLVVAVVFFICFSWIFVLEGDNFVCLAAIITQVN